MLDPRFWVAAFLLLLATSGVMFGVGWHYGDKGKIAVAKYAALVTAKAEVDADLKKAKADYANAASKNATAAHDTDDKLKKADERIATAEKAQAALQRQHQVDAANLATARLMLGDATADTAKLRTAVDAATVARDQGTSQSADLAGRLDSCKQAFNGLVTSSRVNNAELKRAIARRDACVERYETAARNINGG